uniref:Uncharacterized protein n=1 Tax=Strongyloides papillosus TaxID=174720 RepID=A0A0N5BQP2_STREA
MAYYRESSPIPGYTGHIPGSKFHIGGGINRKGIVNNDHKMTVEDFSTGISNDFDNFSIVDKLKNDESRLPSLLNFEIDKHETKEKYLDEENDSEIRQVFSEIPSYRKGSISSNRSVVSKISKKSNNSVELSLNKHEFDSNKGDNASFLNSERKSIKKFQYENEEVRRPMTVGRERKEKLKKKMENIKPTGIWDKKPIPYNEKKTSIIDNIPEMKNNPFEGAEKGWWSEGQALVNLKNIKKNQFNDDSYIDYQKIMTDGSNKYNLNYTENSSIIDDFKNCEE